MNMLFHKLSKAAAKSFYPDSPYCPCCGKIFFDDFHVICDSCAKIIFKPARYSCKICGRAVKAGNICNICYENEYTYDRGVCLLEYNRHTAHIIYSIKYGNNTDLAQRFGSLLYYDINRKSDILHNCDIIIPVPLHKERLIQRGYNQAQKIAVGLAEQSGIEVRDDILLKIIATPDQIGLKKSDREKNLKNSFDIAYLQDIKNKNILLIDDVLTTGATVCACCEILKKHGAKKVSFAVLASKIL